MLGQQVEFAPGRRNVDKVAQMTPALAGTDVATRDNTSFVIAEADNVIMNAVVVRPPANNLKSIR